MAGLILPSRIAGRLREPALLVPGKKPASAVEIDWTHPLAKGLRNILVMNPSFKLKNDAVIYDKGKADFDGATRYVASDDLSWLNGKTELTISLGFTHRAITTNHVALAYTANLTNWTDNTDVALWVDNAGFNTGNTNCISFHPAGAGGTRLESTANSIAPNTPHIVSCTRSSSELKCYIDGALNTTKSGTFVAIPGDAQYGRLGGAEAVLSNFNGTMDFMFVHDRELSADEHAALNADPYQLFKPANDSPFIIPAAAGPVTYTITSAADALLQKTASLTSQVDSMLQVQGATVTVDLGALLQKSRDVASSVDSMLQQAGTVSTDLGALLQKTATANTGADAALQKARDASAGLDSMLQRAGTAWYDLDALLQQAGLTVATALDAVLEAAAPVGQQQADVDALLQSRRLEQADVDALLQSSRLVTAAVDAIIRKIGWLLGTITAAAAVGGDATLTTALTLASPLTATPATNGTITVN